MSSEKRADLNGSCSRKFQVLRAHAEDVLQLKALREIHAKTQHDVSSFVKYPIFSFTSAGLLANAFKSGPSC